jgi:hypothetical protein
MTMGFIRTTQVINANRTGILWCLAGTQKGSTSDGVILVDVNAIWQSQQSHLARPPLWDAVAYFSRLPISSIKTQAMHDWSCLAA